MTHRQEQEQDLPGFPPSHVGAGLTRRQFVAWSAAMAGGAMANAAWGGADAGAVAPEVPASAWRQLSRELSGSLLRPGSRGFSALALPNNLRYQGIRPGGIALCNTPSDIAACLDWCVRQQVPLAIRGGGHSYAGYSCTEGLMINLRAFGDTHYDPADQTVTVGGGVRNGQVYAALQAAGRSITHGRCPTVGAGGFLLGGGIGFDMRANGIASDKVVKTEMVLPDGRFVTASATENPDLFWACRGGAGGNFGINTSFTLDTFPVERCVEFQIGWSSVADDFLASLFATLEAAPRAFGCRASVKPGIGLPKQPTPIDVSLIGQWVGPVDELSVLLNPLMRLQRPDNQTIQEMDYWSASTFLEEPGAPLYFQERSRFVNGPMPGSMIDAMREWLSRWPSAGGTGLIKFFQTGGAANDLAPSATAFVHRSSQWLASIEIDWDPGQPPASRLYAHRWQNGFYQDITPLCGGGAFQNFPDPSLEDWATAYYGENLPRLQQIKAEVDPHNLFRFAQSIRPARRAIA